MIELLAGERQERESKKAVQACNDYMRMGPGRSLAKLHQVYTETTPVKPPTKHLRTLKEWSRVHSWQERAAIYDAEIERQKTEESQAYIRSIMQDGLALTYERVKALKVMVNHLLDELYQTDEHGQVIGLNHDNVWLVDTTLTGQGDKARLTKKRRLNRPLFERIQTMIDDIARETGGRRQSRTNFNFDLTKLTDSQLERIAAGEDPLDVILSDTGRGGA